MCRTVIRNQLFHCFPRICKSGAGRKFIGVKTVKVASDRQGFRRTDRIARKSRRNETPCETGKQGIQFIGTGAQQQRAQTLPLFSFLPGKLQYAFQLFPVG